MEHDRLFKEECAAAAVAAASGELQEVGSDGLLVDSSHPGLGYRLDKGRVHSLESLTLLGKSSESVGNNNHNLPAAAF